MKIAGYINNSMTDYPGMIVDSIFLPFCNLRCSYCHNHGLLKSNLESYIEEDYVFEKFEKQRRGAYSDGICISGGEPSIHKYEVLKFIKEFKERFPSKKIKIDTNGTDPEFIEMISEIADFVSLDFKTLFFHRIEKYCEMDLAKFLNVSLVRITLKGTETIFAKDSASDLSNLPK
jgi:pyruvate formate lyase activating enzyme